jgi:hypothetical protein
MQVADRRSGLSPTRHKHDEGIEKRGLISMQEYTRGLLALVAWVLLSPLAAADSSHPERRALLASPGFEGQPVKGVYFFPGESAGNLVAYTVHPLLADDQHWHSVLSSRTRVIDRIASTGANTVVMSYWGDLPQSMPMCLDRSVVTPSGTCSNPSSDFGVASLLDAMQNRRLVVLPSIESGSPDLNQWAFSSDFPGRSNSILGVAPGLVQRIGQLVQLFRSRDMNLWAQLYDRTGFPRYAVGIIHACSGAAWANDASFAGWFSDVEAQVSLHFGIHVGFVFDLVGPPPTLRAPTLQIQKRKRRAINLMNRLPCLRSTDLHLRFLAAK